MTFAWNQERHGGVLVLAPSGRLDNDSAVDFELAAQEMLEAGERHIVVDLARLNYISNAGLRVLGKLGKALRTPDTSLRLCGLSAAVRQVFDAAGAAAMFDIRPDLRTAIGDHPAARGAGESVREAMRLLGIRADAPAPAPFADGAALAQLAFELMGGHQPMPRAARALAAGTQVVARVRDEDVAAVAPPKKNWWQRLFGKESR
jgi:stage II sporulation protein AA (anti-sigma F factor antagonist)